MNAKNPELAEQFDDIAQQRNAATLGMWVFLATEVLFFGGLFLAYAVYRSSYPEQFMLAAKELNIAIGTINTAVLLCSSFFMALAVSYSQLGKSKAASTMLLITFTLGTLFLALKAYEYYDDYQKHLIISQNSSGMFYLIYYLITGLHAVHVTIGLIIIAAIIVLNNHNKFSEYHTPIELTGLYWHFVDIIWIFIYPLLYLVGRQL